MRETNIGEQDDLRVVVDGHVNCEAERVVDRGRKFALVEKIKPLVRQTVKRLNPRST